MGGILCINTTQMVSLLRCRKAQQTDFRAVSCDCQNRLHKLYKVLRKYLIQGKKREHIKYEHWLFAIIVTRHLPKSEKTANLFLSVFGVKMTLITLDVQCSHACQPTAVNTTAAHVTSKCSLKVWVGSDDQGFTLSQLPFEN